MDKNLANILLSCKLFEGFTAEELDAVLHDTGYSVVHLPSGEVYALEGTACRNADIVLKGKLKALMSGASGKEAVMDVRGPGDFMAPAFIFSHRNNLPVSIHAESEVELFRLSLPEFEALLKKDCRVNFNFLRHISDIAVFLAEKVRLLSLSRVRDKVEFLLTKEYRTQQSSTLILKASRKQIADSFGIQKFSLIRCLNEVQKEGLILVKGKEITLLKPEYFK